VVVRFVHLRHGHDQSTYALLGQLGCCCDLREARRRVLRNHVRMTRDDASHRYDHPTMGGLTIAVDERYDELRDDRSDQSRQAFRRD
jgi:hypothetical protein